MTLKLSRRALALERAEAEIDRRFARLIAEEIGPLGPLHALKRAQAEAGSGPLLSDDREAILARAAEQDGRLAAIDRERRGLKDAVRAASTAAEINEIVAGIG